MSHLNSFCATKVMIQKVGGRCIAGYELSNALSKEYQRSLTIIETLESEVAKMMDTK